MPYKCSVIGCKSNYDSTNEKFRVFQLPADIKIKSRWLKNVQLNSTESKSSRICEKHFDSQDITSTSRRGVLKHSAVPLRNLFRAENLSDHTKPNMPNFHSDLINGFNQLTTDVVELTASFIDHWNIYSHPEGICFYRLSSDDDFNRINISFMILVNKQMRVKIYNQGIEANCNELNWILTDCVLKYWSQLEKILVHYQNKHDILLNNQPMKHLQNALEEISQIHQEEFRMKVNFLKDQIISLKKYANILFEKQQEDYFLEPPDDFTIESIEELDENFDEFQTPGDFTIETVEEKEENFDRAVEFKHPDCVAIEIIGDRKQCFDETVEALEEFLDFQDEERFSHNLEHEKQLTEYYEETNTMISPNRNEYDISSEEVEGIIAYENPLRCPKCFITLLSENGCRMHQKSCMVINNSDLPVLESKFPDSPRPSKPEVSICDICGKIFEMMRSLKHHMKVHDVSLQKKCPYCDVTIYSGKLRRHIKIVHHKVKPYKCSTCCKPFSTKTLRNEHETTHQRNLEIQQHLVKNDESPRYTCPKCSAEYTTAPLLKKHMELNCRLAKKKRLYKYPCGKCFKKFGTKILAAQHLHKAHQVEIKNINKYCFECHEEVYDYTNHVRIHSCNFACRFCGAKFLTEEKTLKHEQSKHSQETSEDRPFKCSEKDCGYSFKNINHLRSHKQAIHLVKEKEFECSHCNKKFGLRAHLTTHVRQHNVCFRCNFESCDRTFKKLNNLKDHFAREHSISNIYLCRAAHCGKRFKMLAQLKAHSEIKHDLSINIKKYFEND